MLNSVTSKYQNASVFVIVCLGLLGCVLMLSVLSGCAASDDSSSTSSSAQSDVVSASSESEDFEGTPKTMRDLQNTKDFKRTQQLSIQIKKGMTLADVTALCGKGTWSDNSDGEMKIEGTAGYCTWVDEDGKWMILAGFDGDSPDALATGEVFMRPVDEHIYDGLIYC